jgi:hypothetical protein
MCRFNAFDRLPGIFANVDLDGVSNQSASLEVEAISNSDRQEAASNKEGKLHS